MMGTMSCYYYRFQYRLYSWRKFKIKISMSPGVKMGCTVAVAEMISNRNVSSYRMFSHCVMPLSFNISSNEG